LIAKSSHPWIEQHTGASTLDKARLSSRGGEGGVTPTVDRVGSRSPTRRRRGCRRPRRCAERRSKVEVALVGKRFVEASACSSRRSSFPRRRRLVSTLNRPARRAVAAGAGSGSTEFTHEGRGSSRRCTVAPSGAVCSPQGYRPMAAREAPAVASPHGLT
jgi:hypothetical protein